MFSSKTLAFLGLIAPFTLAQYGGAPAPAPAASTTTPAAAAAASPSSTSSGAKTTTITAGAGGPTVLSFTPSSVTAEVGTFVEFEFMPLNHSVAQSAFDAPCSPINSSAFYAGFQFAASTSAASNVFTIQINDPDPIWFYCPQTVEGIHHCTEGMVGVINPPSSGNTLTQFIANAKNATTVAIPANIQGGVVAPAAASSSPSATTSGSAASSSPTGSASHLTVGMGFMGLVGIAFSALLSF